MVVADEFLVQQKLLFILKWLVLKDEEVCSVAIPFILFGDSGRKYQPNSIPRLCETKRLFSAGKGPQYKTASRISCTLYPAIHHLAPFPSQRLRAYSSSNNFPRGKRIKVNTNVEDADRCGH